MRRVRVLPRKSCLPRLVSARGSTASTPVGSFVAGGSGYGFWFGGARVDGVNSGEQFRGGEIRIRFLFRRIDVHQDHLGRIVAAGDRALRQLNERFAVET